MIPDGHLVYYIIAPWHFKALNAESDAKVVLLTKICIIVAYSVLVLGGINILLPVYSITNSKRYSVFHGILIKHN